MSIQPRDLLNFSGTLLAITELSEVIARTVINRSYYAAYLGSDFLDELLPQYFEVSNLGGGVHEKRVQKLLNAVVAADQNISTEVLRKIKAIGMILKDLKPFRINADYFLSADISLEDAKYVFGRANACLNKCDEICSLIAPSDMEELGAL